MAYAHALAEHGGNPWPLTLGIVQCQVPAQKRQVWMPSTTVPALHPVASAPASAISVLVELETVDVLLPFDSDDPCACDPVDDVATVAVVVELSVEAQASADPLETRKLVTGPDVNSKELTVVATPREATSAASLPPGGPEAAILPQPPMENVEIAIQRDLPESIMSFSQVLRQTSSMTRRRPPSAGAPT